MYKSALIAAALLLAITNSARAEAGKIYAMDEADCSRVAAGARGQCYLSQGKTPPAKEPMTAARAQAIIEAMADAATDCKIKIEIHGAQAKRQLAPCLSEIESLGKDYPAALDKLLEAGKSGEIGEFTVRMLTRKIQQATADLEYIKLRVKK